MPHRDQLIEIEGELIPPFQTEKAYYFYNGGTRVWLPKSICEWNDAEEIMTLPFWLAEEKGLL